MSSLNQCNFIGYMGKDPETRAMPNGNSVTNFSIGCSERWKDKQSGEMKEKTEWINCVAFAGTADIIAEYGHKGMQVFVTGKMQTRKWQDKEGKDRWTTEILVNEFKMLGRKSDNDQRGGGQETGRQQTGNQGGQQTGGGQQGGGGFDDDIPF